MMHAKALAAAMLSEETLHPALSADLGGLWTHWGCVLKPSWVRSGCFFLWFAV